DSTARRERRLELRDLISLRKIGVEVVLSREHRSRLDRALERDRSANRELHGAVVEDGERPWQSEADGARVRVGGRATSRGAAAEDLGRGRELHVHLEANDHLEPLAPVHAAAHWHAVSPSARSSAYAAANICRSPKCGAMN